jgi:hypothetical protein
MVLFQFSHVAPKVAISHKRIESNLNYKTNREVENLRILLHVGQPIEPINKIWQLQKERKLEICPNPPKVLTFAKLFSLNCDDFLGNFPNSSLSAYCLGLFIRAKMSPQQLQDLLELHHANQHVLPI